MGRIEKDDITYFHTDPYHPDCYLKIKRAHESNQKESWLDKFVEE